MVASIRTFLIFYPHTVNFAVVVENRLAHVKDGRDEVHAPNFLTQEHKAGVVLLCETEVDVTEVLVHIGREAGAALVSFLVVQPVAQKQRLREPLALVALLSNRAQGAVSLQLIKPRLP